jgi:hypothetical protein
MPERSDRPIHVGYLPTPRRHRRFLAVALPGLALVVAAVAIAVGTAQRDPGPGVWSDGEAVSLRGVIAERPYPAIVTSDGELWLLVEMGKRGAQSRVAGAAGASVEVTGWPLRREGRRMLELAPGEESMRRLGEQIELSNAPTQEPTPVALAGEIVDSKCFLGAMKPGDGKAHKACATLCVTGGIPPVLVTFGADGSTLGFYLIVDAAGDSANALAAPLLGEPVVIEGLLEQWADLRVIRVAPDGLRRR